MVLMMGNTARRVLQGFPLGTVFLNALVNDLEKTDNKRVMKFADDTELFMVIESNIPIRSCRIISTPGNKEMGETWC